MSSLTGNLISATYQGLLKFVDNTAITSVTKSITDGDGNVTPLSIGTSLVKVSGSAVEVTGSSFSLTDGNGVGHTMITAANVTTEDHTADTGVYMDWHGIEFYSGSNYLDITVDATSFQSGGSGSLIAVSNASANPVPVVGFQNHDNYIDGTVSILTPLQAKANAQVTGSLKVSGSIQMNAYSSFVLPLHQPTSPVTGTAFFSGSFLYVYNGAAFVSASLF